MALKSKVTLSLVLTFFSLVYHSWSVILLQCKHVVEYLNFRCTASFKVELWVKFRRNSLKVVGCLQTSSMKMTLLLNITFLFQIKI